MVWVRSHIPRIAAAWLVCHLCLLVAIPTVMCSSMAGQGVAAECTCEHGDGQACPMHKSRSTSATSNSHPCTCRGTADPMAAVAAALFGHVADLGPTASAAAPVHATPWFSSLNPEPLDSDSVPDSPPPRA